MAAALAAAAASCGDSSSSPSPTPTPTSTITITTSGVSIVVPRGSQVTFINRDAHNHVMESDPHPEHTDCPEINSVGSLDPGQTRQTGNLNITRSCGFHDHEDANNRSLRGTITIQ